MITKPWAYPCPRLVFLNKTFAPQRCGKILRLQIRSGQGKRSVPLRFTFYVSRFTLRSRHALRRAILLEETMSILNARNLSIQYGTQASPLFEGVSFEINERDKIGLISPNGCGKTTLLRILLGKACADSGHVHLGHHVRIGLCPGARRSRSGSHHHLRVPRPPLHRTHRR